MARRKCNHSSAIVLSEFKDHGLTLLLCTWACSQLYWTRLVGITTYQITAREAARILHQPAPAAPAPDKDAPHVS